MSSTLKSSALPNPWTGDSPSRTTDLSQRSWTTALTSEAESELSLGGVWQSAAVVATKSASQHAKEECRRKSIREQCTDRANGCELRGFVGGQKNGRHRDQ